MGSCELCGAPDASISVQVEGVDMKVCRRCQKHGTLQTLSHQRQGHIMNYRRQSKNQALEQRLVANFSQLLRQARGERNMTNGEFARLLNEKESVVAKWEAGTMRPPLKTAARIGSILGLNLIESEAATDDKNKTDGGSDRRLYTRPGAEELTLGDFIKVRKRS